MARLVRTVSGPDRVISDLNAKPPAMWLFDLWDRRWVRAVVIGVVLLIGGTTAWYQVAVRPTLTATRLSVSVAERDSDVVLEVDDEAGIVRVLGGQRGLSEFFVSGDSIFVLTSEVGAEVEARWVEVPIRVVGARAAALTPSRILSAISRNAKQCLAPSGDARIILGALLDVPDAAQASVTLCGSAWNRADPQHLVVRRESVRPADIDPLPSSSVIEVAQTADPDAVVATLKGLLGR
jgi:hypothetical protein